MVINNKNYRLTGISVWAELTRDVVFLSERSCIYSYGKIFIPKNNRFEQHIIFKLIRVRIDLSLSVQA